MLERHPDPQAVAVRAVDLLAETLAARPEAVLLLPAGATPIPFYAELVRRTRAGRIDPARAHLFQLDELCGVGPADPRGFHAFLREHLIEPLGLSARFHGLDGTRAPQAEIERHRRALEALGPADLALLGLGANGHVAFNEPGSRVTDAARVVALEETTLRGLARAFPEGAPRQGITLGMAEIAAARSLVLLVTGASKADVLAHVLAGPPTSACPASLLASSARFLVLADENAVARATSPGA